MEREDKVVVEGLVSVGRYGDDVERTVWVYEGGPDEASNLADIIERELGSGGGAGLYGPMRITIERTE